MKRLIILGMGLCDSESFGESEELQNRAGRDTQWGFVRRKCQQNIQITKIFTGDFSKTENEVNKYMAF